MGLADAILPPQDPTKGILLTFGTLAKINNEKRQLDLLQQRQAQDQIFRAADLELRQRMFGLDAQVKGLQMKRTSALLDAASREVNEQDTFEDALAQMALDGEPLVSRLSSADPEKRNAALSDYGELQAMFGASSSAKVKASMSALLSTYEKASERVIKQQNADTSSGNLNLRGKEYEHRLEKDAKRDSAAEDVIRFPAAAGGGTMSAEKVRETLGKPLLNPDDRAAADEADLLRRKLQSIGRTDPLSQKFNSLYTTDDFSSWAEQGAQRLKEKTAKPDLLKGIEPLPYPADPGGFSPEALIPQQPQKAAPLDQLLDLYKLKTPTRTSAIGFGGFGPIA